MKSSPVFIGYRDFLEKEVLSMSSEKDIWYPDEETVIKVHDIMLKRYGGIPALNEEYNSSSTLSRMRNARKASIGRQRSFCEGL